MKNNTGLSELKYLKDVLGVRHIGKSSKKKPVENLPAAESFNSMTEAEAAVKACVKCKLSKSRTNTVFGSGNPRAELMFIGEGPGEQEDLQCLPFVGAAGKLLTKMIEAMGLQREDVYIANIVKCRPPNNRKPEPDEVQSCFGYLDAQIGFVKPKLVVALGATAVEALLNTEERIGKLRGKVLPFRKIKLIATYHPAYLLRNPPAKKQVWEDLQLAMEELGLKRPQKN